MFLISRFVIQLLSSVMYFFCEERFSSKTIYFKYYMENKVVPEFCYRDETDKSRSITVTDEPALAQQQGKLKLYPSVTAATR